MWIFQFSALSVIISIVLTNLASSVVAEFKIEIDKEHYTIVIPTTDDSLSGPDSELVKHLTILGSEATTLSTEIFAPFLNVKTITAQNLKLQNVPAAFANGPFKKLECLNLEDNQLQQLDKSAFAGLPNLLTLNLQSNRIIDLPKNVFQNLSHLNRLMLSENKLTTLDLQSFVSNTKLTTLELRRNRLTSAMYTTERLRIQRLYLTENLLTEFPLEAFPELVDLDLSNNVNFILNENTFARNPHLVYLQLYNVSLNHNEHWYRSLKPLVKLVQLFVGKNRLTHVSIEDFPKLEHLTNLDLEYNQLERIDVNALKKRFSRIKHVKTTGNPLTCDTFVNGARQLHQLNMTLTHQTTQDFKMNNDSVVCGGVVYSLDPVFQLTKYLKEIVVGLAVLVVVTILTIICCQVFTCTRRKKIVRTEVSVEAVQKRDRQSIDSFDDVDDAGYQRVQSMNFADYDDDRIYANTATYTQIIPHYDTPTEHRYSRPNIL